MECIAALALLAGASPAPGAAEFDHSHAKLTAVLEDVLDEGLVDYAALRRSPDALDAYLATLESVTQEQFRSWTADQQFAFWINVYNAYTIQLVRDEGPVKSIKEIGGWFTTPWEKQFIPLGAFDPDGDGEELTLDEVEHEILRPWFHDARVHAAINCASLGCPPLRAEAYRADVLDRQLDDQVALWLADTSLNRVRPDERGVVRVSKIFDWFEEDFDGDDESVVRWIADHVEDEELAETLRSRAGELRVRYLDYDWSINAQEGKR